MDRKAQTATEYLIILAVVIIIALIIVGVLGGIPGVGRSSAGRASAAYWSSADIALTDYAFDAGGDSNAMKIRNNLRNQITVTNVRLGGTDLITTDQSINPGETKNMSINTHKDCGDGGDSFSYDVIVDYTDSGTGASYTFTGDGNKLEGTCAN
ncbi:hypothetical protein HYU10_00230 [Candidatus Woesearchaeota archaeon]|nr:hypothetical protein [Candidatus Woesearchaeota archaeon]MBI2661011.1 hypothetical protein [Candidatus Woesearchaeota archaeon]